MYVCVCVRVYVCMYVCVCMWEGGGPCVHVCVLTVTDIVMRLFSSLLQVHRLQNTDPTPYLETSFHNWR